MINFCMRFCKICHLTKFFINLSVFLKLEFPGFSSNGVMWSMEENIIKYLCQLLNFMFLLYFLKTAKPMLNRNINSRLKSEKKR